MFKMVTLMLHILYHNNKTKQCGLTPNLQDYNFLEWGLKIIVCVIGIKRNFTNREESPFLKEHSFFINITWQNNFPQSKKHSSQRETFRSEESECLECL